MDFRAFERQARSAAIVSLSEEIPADLLTPAAVYLALVTRQTSASFLFESVEGGESVGRYSFIGADPVETLTVYEPGGVIARGRRRRRFSTDETLDVLRACMPRREVLTSGATTHGFFSGGWVGYFGYDCVRLFERIPSNSREALEQPWIMLGLYDRIVVFDHVRQSARVVVTVFPDGRSRSHLRSEYDTASRRLDATVRRLHSRPVVPPLGSPRHGRIRSNTTRERFCESVRVAKRHIARGDIFQGVLSQRFSVEGRAKPFDVYRRLRRANPSPYMYFVRFGELAVAGSSPETLVQKRGALITTRPIAGTRRRGADHQRDLALERQLRASPKERAEHVMLVDLGRNDIGRVCRPGSVDTVQFCAIDRYSHVMHMVSTVTGTAKRNTDAFDVLAATFPAGTVSGAPKIRAMEIIDELEPDRRGVYAGSVGYVDWRGDMDMAIAIRTAVMDGRASYVQAGAGIVADSDPMREYRETQNKAAAPLAAVGGEWSREMRP
ncbi:MAG TPA: anthranilate synthase component I [candidate division Zixibacteria bacterium]|jgi:anthranilate synthase component 1